MNCIRGCLLRLRRRTRCRWRGRRGPARSWGRRRRSKSCADGASSHCRVAEKLRRRASARRFLFAQRSAGWRAASDSVGLLRHISRWRVKAAFEKCCPARLSTSPRSKVQEQAASSLIPCVRTGSALFSTGIWSFQHESEAVKACQGKVIYGPGA